MKKYKVTKEEIEEFKKEMKNKKYEKEMKEIRKITGIKKEIPYYFPFNFYAFYLKTATHDTPCRIEFFMDEKPAATVEHWRNIVMVKPYQPDLLNQQSIEVM